MSLENLKTKCLEQTLFHIKRVNHFLNICVKELIDRCEHHDDSKLEEPELSGFAINTEKLSKVEYGSTEYTEMLKELKPTIEHHYANNRHHAEFFASEEVWKEAKGYEGFYEISSKGRIKNKKGEILRPALTPVGYFRASLAKKKIKKNHLIHRMVAEAFIENPDDKPIVNHINSNRLDNFVENLEWATASENLIHAYESGYKKSCVKYLVYCPELNIATRGIEKMVKVLRKNGYEKANSGTILGVLKGRGKKHLDLSFERIDEDGFHYLNSYISDMNLIDVLEMLCDWRAAGERNKNGNIKKSIEVNAERYGLSPQLRKILENTARDLFK